MFFQNTNFNNNIISEIFDSLNFIKEQILMILNKKDIFNNKDLVAFSYLLGYFTSKNKKIYINNEILDSILDFSFRKKSDVEDMSNIIINYSLILNNDDNKINITKNKENIFKINKNKINNIYDNNLLSLDEEKQIDYNKKDVNDDDNINFKLFIDKDEKNENISKKDDKTINSNNNINISNFNLLNNSKKNININKNNNDNSCKINLIDNINNSNIKIKNTNLKENNLNNFNLNNDEKPEFLGKKTNLLQKIKNCEICFEDFNEYDSLNYELECGCIIHNECFDDYIKNCVENNNIPILCPKCKIEVHPNFIYESLNVNGHKDLIEKYEKFSMNNYVLEHKDSYSCCPTPGCEYMFFFEEGENRFLCPMCNKEYCLFCKETWHKGMTCQEYIDSKDEKKLDEKFLNFVKGKNYKVCPKCGVWVEKTYGCNFMRCRCGNQFCYKCGKNFSLNNHYCSCPQRQNIFFINK